MNIEAAHVCPHVFGNTHPVLLVSRAGGVWKCLCGDDHEPGAAMQIIGWHDLLERDASLAELRNLPDEGEAARLSANARWVRARLQPHE